MKVELGGGVKPKAGFVNIDLVQSADIVHDLNQTPWPLEEGSVEELYSSHCLEHLASLPETVREIARVCALGARVTLRLPHWNSEMAMCQGHTFTIPPTQVRHWQEFAADWFPGRKCLGLVSQKDHPDHLKLMRARPLFPNLNDEQLMEFVPGCGHETEFVLDVRWRK